MRLLNHLLYYGIIIPISLLPFRALYVLSDGLYLILFKGIGYRKQVVQQNLRNSFPDKSTEEINELTRLFYGHFCDLILESLKVFTISQKQANERMLFKNPEVINKYASENRNVMLAGGHMNNWELFAVAVAGLIEHKAVALYKPLTSQYFDQRMRESRGKFGLQMVSTKNAKEYFETPSTQPTATIFGVDQSPPNPSKCYWTTFLNQDTGVLFGCEKFAKEYNHAVVYGRINKEKRGYYSFEFIDISATTQQSAHGEIMEAVTRLLEKDIMRAPQYWLWTHKRWKHKRPAEQAAFA
ncbi:MAG: lysophospholipid acyltransferase family protein [Bacteroidetes bacterium]|nr:lysophospholipid acyltransferase family protein [Bacteroidota bacterium]